MPTPATPAARRAAKSGGAADSPAQPPERPNHTSTTAIGSHVAGRVLPAARAERRFVVRYDNRDTGQSTSYPAGSPGYTGSDLVADAVGLLDAFKLSAAHIVGISMGGGIAQHLAVDHPGRVASLTLISTSPDGPGGPDQPVLPPMREDLRAMFAEPAPDPEWSDREAVIDHLIASERLFFGSYPVDEEHLRTLVGRICDRTTDIAASMTNHWILEGGEPVRHRFQEIVAPTQVLHGTEDPLFPYGPAEALAREIPSARLVPLEKVGHQMPPPQVWDVVIATIAWHTSGQEQR